MNKMKILYEEDKTSTTSVVNDHDKIEELIKQVQSMDRRIEALERKVSRATKGLFFKLINGGFRDE